MSDAEWQVGYWRRFHFLMPVHRNLALPFVFIFQSALFQNRVSGLLDRLDHGLSITVELPLTVFIYR